MRRALDDMKLHPQSWRALFYKNPDQSETVTPYLLSKIGVMYWFLRICWERLTGALTKLKAQKTEELCKAHRVN